MGREDHIRSLRIQNFKCFEDFTMENIGQFNLIVGANNSGKTSLLEGLLMMQSGGDRYLYQALRKRFGAVRASVGSEEFDFIHLLKHHNKLREPIQLFLDYHHEFPKRWELDSKSLKEISSDDSLSGELQRRYGSHWVSAFKTDARFVVSSRVDSAFNGYRAKEEWDMKGIVHCNEQEFELAKDDFLPFVGASDFYSSDLVSAYESSIHDNERKKELLDVMGIIIPELYDIETRRIGPWGPVLCLWLKSQNPIARLADFGDGTVRLFRIALTMFRLYSDLKPRILMIDEVDYGIHENLLPKFWETFIELATRLDIQVFMTTHNEECVKAYWKAFESDELKNKWGIERDEIARHFILERDKDGIPRSYSVPLSHLGHAIEDGNNFMGR